MTTREFYEVVAALENVDAELINKANELIEKMDSANAKRKAAPKKVSPETEEKRNNIYAALTADFQSASQIAAATGYSTNTVSGIMRYFVDNGLVEKGDIRNEKNASCKGYRLAVSE